MNFSIWQKCDICGCICDEWSYDPETDTLMCFDCMDELETNKEDKE